MAIDVLNLFSVARNMYGYQGSLADVKAAVEEFDRTPYEAAERARYRYEIWDGETPFGGYDAQWWIEHWGNEYHPNGKVYLIYIDGHLRVVQHFDPESVGFVPMDEETARARAEAFINERVEAAVDEIVQREVLMRLLAS